ncbi:hypothetical protein [Celeribacter baekdonensis]|uniref:hypothetical protein n=1 Tax=Celeribacter baekdonensis TaxID=875171 RepID=UPI0030DBA121
MTETAKETSTLGHEVMDRTFVLSRQFYADVLQYSHDAENIKLSANGGISCTLL